MKRRPNTIKRRIARIISRHLKKVEVKEGDEVKFEDLSTDDQKDLIEELQRLIDYDVYRQFNKAQKLRATMRDTQLENK